ncbi:MAG TPA: hypothetical protein VGK99_21025 [Acidobacteriota bacterium]|jgi:hypothetical protein
MKFISSAAAVLIFGAGLLFPATGDEMALKARASRFYALQMEGKRILAAELVEPKTRDLFLSGRGLHYSRYKIDRVLVTGSDTAEVEVTVELILEMFPQPISRSVTTNWKKITGKWYFVVDTSALEAFRRGMAAMPAEPKAVLAYKPIVVFGQDAEIQKSVRLQNNSTGMVEFRIAGWDDEWFDIKNRSGEIPAGEYFPLVITLKQMPERLEKKSILVEGILPDKQIHRLEIPVTLNAPAAALRKQMQDAIRKYRAEH